jgi:hypothetical protein
LKTYKNIGEFNMSDKIKKNCFTCKTSFKNNSGVICRDSSCDDNLSSWQPVDPIRGHGAKSPFKCGETKPCGFAPCPQPDCGEENWAEKENCIICGNPRSPNYSSFCKECYPQYLNWHSIEYDNAFNNDDWGRVRWLFYHWAAEQKAKLFPKTCDNCVHWEYKGLIQDIKEEKERLDYLWESTLWGICNEKKITTSDQCGLKMGCNKFTPKPAQPFAGTCEINASNVADIHTSYNEEGGFPPKPAEEKKVGSPCVRCGEITPNMIYFDHLNSDNKGREYPLCSQCLEKQWFNNYPYMDDWRQAELKEDHPWFCVKPEVEKTCLDCLFIKDECSVAHPDCFMGDAFHSPDWQPKPKNTIFFPCVVCHHDSKKRYQLLNGYHKGEYICGNCFEEGWKDVQYRTFEEWVDSLKDATPQGKITKIGSDLKMECKSCKNEIDVERDGKRAKYCPLCGVSLDSDTPSALQEENAKLTRELQQLATDRYDIQKDRDGLLIRLRCVEIDQAKLKYNITTTVPRKCRKCPLRPENMSCQFLQKWWGLRGVFGATYCDSSERIEQLHPIKQQPLWKLKLEQNKFERLYQKHLAREKQEDCRKEVETRLQFLKEHLKEER